MNEVKFEVRHELPPEWIYKKCVKRFGADFWKGTNFAYGNIIYGPIDPKPDIMLHECVHLSQQAKFKSPDDWWKKYFSDSAFRLEQEKEAYSAQWKKAKEIYPRQYRRLVKAHIIKSLSGKLYGNLITKKEAEQFLNDVV